MKNVKYIIILLSLFFSIGKISAMVTDNDTISGKVSQLCDSLICDTVKNVSDTIVDTFSKFKKVERDMMSLIAHCEGVKANAYYDPHARLWTIGFGNTVRPDGKPVRRGDRIKSESELMDYFTAHVEGKMFMDMNTYLPLDSMLDAEIVAVGSFLYNCGSGILRTKDGSPSELAKALCDYVANRNDTTKAKVKVLMDRRTKSGGRVLPQLQKRRELEERILFGELLLDNEGELNLANAINLSECALGGVYCFRSLPDTIELCERLSNIQGKNLNDSIQSQIRKAPAPIMKK